MTQLNEIIGKEVKSVEINEAKELELMFEDGTIIVISATVYTDLYIRELDVDRTEKGIELK